MLSGEIALVQFVDLLKSFGVKRLFMKLLAENDNSKNQVYFGPDFGSLQIFPNQGVLPDKNNFKAKVDFHWLNDDQKISNAPNAQLILYPDYPEVRFSGFLLGAKNAPSDLLNKRLSDRVLFFGICDDGKIIGYATKKDSTLFKEISELRSIEQVGVFYKLPLGTDVDSKTVLLHELKRIHDLGWIGSKRLTSIGERPCLGTNCGGLTLEAELGVITNSKSEPDFMGYEVKQYHVTNFDNIYSGSAITLMTPEPKGGLYKDAGFEAFIRKYGYKDARKSDRLNFSGIHRVNDKQSKTGLTLKIDGYDFEHNKITKVNGAILLVDDSEFVAAAWYFADIMSHWSRKHALAVYVPSNKRNQPELQYAYGHTVLLAEKTDSLHLLKAFANQTIYYDPGIHLDNINTKPISKRRSQFRIKPKNLGELYESTVQENLSSIN